MRRINIAAFCMFMIFMFPGICMADVFMKHRQHTDEIVFMGQTQPARDEVRSTWISGDMIRSDSGIQGVIVRMDKNIMYLLDHQKKSYVEMPLDVSKMGDMASKSGEMDAEEKQAFENFARGMMDVKVTVTDTGIKKKINKWNCRKYIHTTQTMMGPVSQEIWATEDLKMDYDLYARLNAGQMMIQPGMSENMQAAIKEMKKIKGVPVYSESKTMMMGMEVRTTDELVDYRNKKAPKGYFEIPEGYARETM